MPSPYIVSFRYRPPGADPFGVAEALLTDGSYLKMDVNALDSLINPADLVQYVEGLIASTGAGTYTLTVPVPAGATVRDVTVTPEVPSDASTSSTLNVGDDGDPDGYFTAVDMKAQTTEMSCLLSSTGVGVFQASEQRYATANHIIFVIVQVGTGTAARTRCRVYFEVPSTVLAAVKT